MSPKVLLGLVLVALVVYVIIDTVTTGYVRMAIDDFLQWILDNLVAGVFLFVLGTLQRHFFFYVFLMSTIYI
jgi:hypothetical protein